VDDTRRKICQAAGLALLARALPACEGGGPAPADLGDACTTGIGAGTAQAVPLDGAVKIEFAVERFFLCRDAGGIYAVEAGCPHLGCDVVFKNAQEGFECPCHLARFDFAGQNPTAPAMTPLKHYLVCASPSGSLEVDFAQVVDPSTRLKV
jgi:nitrite reductase/ring-hydroxylating ferredoxin subunit